MRFTPIFAALAFTFWVPGALTAAENPPAAAHGTDAISLIETHCIKCHGGEKTKAGLALTTRDTLLRGGESGVAVVPGQAESSLLYRMVTHQEDPGMPHKEDKLPDEQIRQIADWIRADVPYSRIVHQTVPVTTPKTAFAITEDDRAHWAFQPVKPHAVSPVQNRAWVKTPLDAFILARLDAEGLQPSPPASKEALIRRVSLDLIGLPPTPAEIDAFIRDASADA